MSPPAGTAPRRVLMMAYAYPPLVVAGAIRAAAFAAHLPDTGWTPLVLTVSRSRDRSLLAGDPVPAGIATVRAPEWNLAAITRTLQGVTNRVYKRLGRPTAPAPWRRLLAFPDEQIAWLATLPGLFLAWRSDCIFVTCPPFSAALKAWRLSRLTGKPLILDFRDGWLLDSHAHRSPAEQARIGRHELKLLRDCHRVILNTDGTLGLYRDRYPQYAHKMLVIPNGFDPDGIPCARDVRRQPLRVTHIGHLYGSRSADLVLECLAELGDPTVEFVQVGLASTELQQFQGAVRVTTLGFVNREEAWREMQRASILYLRQGIEPGVGVHTAIASKTYEYLATGLPILAECPPGDNADIVRRYGACAEVVTTGRKEDLRRALASLLARMETYVPAVNPAFHAAFNRRALTFRLAEVLETTTGTGSGDRAGEPSSSVAS